MKKIIIFSTSWLCLFLLLAVCAKANSKAGSGAGNRTIFKDIISAKFNGKLKLFKFRVKAVSSLNGSLLMITGFAEDDSQSPSLELILGKEEGKITTGTYYLGTDPNKNVSARYTIERAKDGALVTNTVYETRDIGNKNDLIITISSLAHGRVKGTFSGVITTVEDVKIAKRFALSEGKFDVRLKSD